MTETCTREGDVDEWDVIATGEQSAGRVRTGQKQLHCYNVTVRTRVVRKELRPGLKLRPERAIRWGVGDGGKTGGDAP